MNKGIIYYTDCRLNEPIMSTVQKYIADSGLPIVSCSLNSPINFGQNYVIKNRTRGYVTMLEQIIMALEHLNTDYVFFCEHDVLYHTSHFEFLPLRDDTYYYNTNVWQWRYPTDYAITYDNIISLSELCCNRQLALNHFRSRWKKIKELQLDLVHKTQPGWVKKWGYEPGVARKDGTGFSKENYELRKSVYPNIDIRHKFTLTGNKTYLKQFIHIPRNWKEINLNQIPGWDLKKIFNLNENRVYSCR